MNFGEALEALKDGRRAARAGWNGRGMWLMLVGFRCETYEVNADLREDGKPFRGRLLPWIGMKTAQGDFVPWLASQTDLLADDWAVIDNYEPLPASRQEGDHA